MSRRIPVMTEDEFKAVMREAVHAELKTVGLRLDDADHAEATSADLRFLRSFRQSVDGVASKVGMAIILAVISGLLAATWQGIKLVVGK